MEIFFSSLEEQVLKVKVPEPKFSNLTRGQRGALHNLKNDKTIVIKGADKGSAVIVWEREDYIMEAENQFGDAKKVKSYIKDTNDFLKTLRSLTNLPDNRLLCTMDVVVLYPNISHGEGLSALRKRLDERDEKDVSTDTLVVELLKT